MARPPAWWASRADGPASRLSEFTAWHESQRESIGHGRDRADMRSTEMHGKEQGAVLGAVFQHPTARGTCLRRELAKPRVPVRRVNLQRMMEGVAAEQRPFP